MVLMWLMNLINIVMHFSTHSLLYKIKKSIVFPEVQSSISIDNLTIFFDTSFTMLINLQWMKPPHLLVRTRVSHTRI